MLLQLSADMRECESEAKSENSPYKSIYYHFKAEWQRSKSYIWKSHFFCSRILNDLTASFVNLCDRRSHLVWTIEEERDFRSDEWQLSSERMNKKARIKKWADAVTLNNDHTRTDLLYIYICSNNANKETNDQRMFGTVCEIASNQTSWLLFQCI